MPALRLYHLPWLRGPFSPQHEERAPSCPRPSRCPTKPPRRSFSFCDMWRKRAYFVRVGPLCADPATVVKRYCSVTQRETTRSSLSRISSPLLEKCASISASVCVRLLTQETENSRRKRPLAAVNRCRFLCMALVLSDETRYLIGVWRRCR